MAKKQEKFKKIFILVWPLYLLFHNEEGEDIEATTTWTTRTTKITKHGDVLMSDSIAKLMSDSIAKADRTRPPSQP